MYEDGEIEERFLFVTKTDENGKPSSTASVPKRHRDKIHLHYLPARRDPSDHVAYGATALVGRLLRAAMIGDTELAEHLIQAADMDEIRAWTESLWGKAGPYVRPRALPNSPTFYRPPLRFRHRRHCRLV